MPINQTSPSPPPPFRRPPPHTIHNPKRKQQRQSAQPHHKRKTINTTNTIGIRPPLNNQNNLNNLNNFLLHLQIICPNCCPILQKLLFLHQFIDGPRSQRRPQQPPVNEDILDTGVYCNALVLTFQESRKFKRTIRRRQSNVNVPIGVLYPSLKPPHGDLGDLIYSSSWGYRRCSFLAD